MMGRLISFMRKSSESPVPRGGKGSEPQGGGGREAGSATPRVCSSERDSRSLGSHSMPVLGEARWGAVWEARPAQERSFSGVGK